MAKFRKGDRVVAIKDGYDNDFEKGMTGTVDANSENPWVLWDNYGNFNGSGVDNRWLAPEGYIRLLEKSWDNLEVGDTLARSGVEYRVLGVVGELVFISQGGDPNISGSFSTPHELQAMGFIIKQASPADETTELSVAELEEKLDLKPGTLRVKKG